VRGVVPPPVPLRGDGIEVADNANQGEEMAVVARQNRELNTFVEVAGDFPGEP
jgi:hypothetical protein